MAARAATTFSRWAPWEIQQLPKHRRDWLYDYILDAADYQREASGDDEGSVTDIDVDRLVAARGI